MNRRKLALILLALCLLAAFVLWTVAVYFVDRAAIGPQESVVGFSTVNGFIHGITGVHMYLYTVTDWLGLVPICFMMGFAVLGLVQWVQRRQVQQVDFSILILGGFYLVVIVIYFLFEKIVINYRPVLICGILEPSYPSTTTLLVLCVMPTAIMQLHERIQNPPCKRWATFSISAFTAFMVIGRFLSGVHWFTDIIGGILLSSSLVSIYAFLIWLKRPQ